MIKRIGKYEIQAELGHGGFGRVYRGYDPKVGWNVAIKVLSSDGDPDSLARFHGEAGMTGNLRHKNIVTVHEYGEQDGTPYLVMELLEGENLHQIIEKQRPLSILQKVEIMSQVAEALHYAHQKRVVHRDVKPANIMLLPDGNVKIMDFGIARMTSQGTRRTRQGDLIGSILYMGPEQFRNVDADPLTDIFSYGVTFYELLTGRNPFYANDVGAAMYQITSVEPVRIREIVADCPPPLESVIHRALSKDRDLRYQNLNDVVIDLQPILLELRQERVPKILEGVPQLIAAEQWEKADSLIREALDLDPANREARQFRGRIQDEIQSVSRRRKVDGAIKEAEELVAQQRLGESVPLYEYALRLEPGDQGIRSRLEEVKGYIEARRRAGRLLAEARGLTRQADLDGAFGKVRGALEAVPGNQEALVLEQELLEQIEERERCRKERSILEQAQARRAQEDYEGALELLATDESNNLHSGAIAEYRARLEAEWATEVQRRRNEEFESQLQMAEKLLDQQNVSAVEEVLRETVSRFPEQSDTSIHFAELRNRLNNQRKSRRIAGIRQDVVNLCEAGQFNSARDTLRVALVAFPEEPAIKSLLEGLTAAEAEHARNLRIADINETVHQLQRVGDLKEALRILQSPDTEVLADAALREWRQQLELDLARQDREEGLRKAIEEGQHLLDLGQWDQALATLTAQSNRYPGEPALRVLLDEAQRRVEQEEERRVIAQIIYRTTALESARQWRMALDEAEQAAKTYPHNPTLELLMAHLKKTTQEQERLADLSALRQQIEELLQEKNWTAAELALKSARERFPGELQFGILSDRLRRAQSMSDLEGLIRQVDLHLAQDNVRAASELLDSIRSQFAQETLWQVSHRELERRQRYLDALIDATTRLGSQDYAGAEQVLNSVIPIAPDLRAVKLRKRVIAEREESEKRDAARQLEEESVRQREESLRQKSEEVKRIIESAAESNRNQAYDEALRILTEGLRMHPDQVPLKQMLQSTQAAKQALERERALKIGLEQCESLRRSRQWQQALELIAKLLSEHPNNRDLLDMEVQVRQQKSQADRQIAIRTAVGQAEEHLSAGRPEAALSLLASAARTLGADHELSAMQEKAEQAQLAVLEKQAQYEQKVSEEAAEVRRGINRKEWGWVQAKLDEVTKLFPSESVFSRLDEEMTRCKRDDLIQKLSEGRRLLNLGQVQKAEDFVSANLRSHSEDPAVVSLRADIDAEKRRQESVRAAEKQRAEFVMEGLRASQACAQKGNLAEALSVLKKCLERYPENTELIEEQARVSEQLRAARRRQLFDALRQALDATDWSQALDLLDRARQEYPNDPALIPLEARALDLRRAFWESAVAAIRTKLAENKIEDAQTLFDQNLARYPDQSIVRAVAEEIAAGQAKREADERKRAFLAESLKQAAQCERQREFSQAVAILQKALKKHPADPELSNALNSLQDTIAREKRKQAEAAKTSAVKKFLDHGNWEAALRGLEDIRAAAIENPAEVASLEKQARELRKREFQGLVDKATGFLKLGNLADAEKILDKKLTPFAAETAVVTLATAIKEEKVRQNLIQTARSHTAARRFEEAEAAINELAARSPRDPEEGRLRSALEAAREREEKERLYRAGRTEGDQLLRKRQYSEAIARFECLLTQFPGDRTLQQDLAGAIDAERRSQKERQPAQDPRQPEPFLERQIPQGVQKSRGLLYGIAGIALAGVAAAIWIFHPRMDVYPQELSFQFHPGTPIEVQKVVITGLSGALSPIINESWVTVTRGNSGSGKTEFLVGVTPDGLRPGEHSADLTFPSHHIVHVKLEVPNPSPFSFDTTTLTFVPDQHGNTPPQKIVATGSSSSTVPDPKSTAAWVGFKRHDISPGKTEFMVQVSSSGVAAGSSAELIFSRDSKVHVAIAASKIELQPSSLRFPDPQGGMQPQRVMVTGSPRVTDPASTAGWVKYTKRDIAQGKAEFWVYPSLDSLPPDMKLAAELVFSADKKVHIDLTVPGFTIQPTSLNFPGPGGGMQSQVITVTGPSKIPDLQSTVPWVGLVRRDISPGKVEFTASVFPDRVTPGRTEKTELTLTADDTVHVSLTVPDKLIEVQPAELQFTYTGGGPPPPPKIVTVTGSTDIPEPTKTAQWLQVTRVTPSGAKTQFKIEVLSPEKLPFVNYSSDVTFPPQKKVRIDLKISERAEAITEPFGSVRWGGGTLNPGEELFIRDRRVLNNGPGSVLGHLLHENMHIKRVAPKITVLQEPNQGNLFTLRLKNETLVPVNHLEIEWNEY